MKFQCVTSVYKVRDYKEGIEEALEALWNNRQETFRDIIYSTLQNMQNVVDEAGINQKHPEVDEFNCPELQHLNAPVEEIE